MTQIKQALKDTMHTLVKQDERYMVDVAHIVYGDDVLELDLAEDGELLLGGRRQDLLRPAHDHVCVIIGIRCMSGER